MGGMEGAIMLNNQKGTERKDGTKDQGDNSMNTQSTAAGGVSPRLFDYRLT